MHQQTITNLIEQCKHNNTGAYRELVEAHQTMVYSLAFRMIGSSDEAQDITQETFIKAWTHLQRFDTNMKFSTWLYKIATNLCYDKIRWHKRRYNVTSININDYAVLNHPSDENIECELINNDLAQLISALTNNLSPKQKLVFTLRDIGGLEVAEIEVITGLTAEKIKSNLYLARQFIKSKIEKK